MNTLYFDDCLDVLKEPNKQHPGKTGLGEMLTIKSTTKRLIKEKEDEFNLNLNK